MSTHAELRHVKLSGAAVLEDGVILDRLNQHSALQRLFLLGGDHELAQPVRPRLGPRKHARRQHLFGSFCAAALAAAFRYGQPEILNADQVYSS